MSGHDHFQGQDPLRHIAQVQTMGIEETIEVHGAETPGSLCAFFDSLRDGALLLASFAVVCHILSCSSAQAVLIAAAVSAGYTLWRGCRAAHFAYFRLERLHRVAFEEKREIETNRAQEKLELKALYRTKGFEGKLLDDVVDVLMADNERCLRVMLEEEMGFRLNENEHPLLQGLGGALGIIAAFFGSLLLAYFFALPGIICGAILVAAFSWGLSAKREKNRVIPALVWGASEVIACLSIIYFLMKSFVEGGV